jgi:hypothetical protein
MFLSRHPGFFIFVWRVRSKAGWVSARRSGITRFAAPSRMISPAVGDAETGISAARAMPAITTVTGNIWMLDT